MTEPADELDRWIVTVCKALDLEPALAGDRGLVLDVARDVAHGVLRPAAPISAYLLGIAIGRGADPAWAVAAISGLADSWSTAQLKAAGHQPVDEPSVALAFADQQPETD